MESSGIQASQHTASCPCEPKWLQEPPAITSMSRAAWKEESDKGGTPPFE